jgi:peroxiredoxin Q/BCP
MVQLHREYEKFTERGAEIVVVAPEDRETLRAYWQREKLPFVGLADPLHAVADRYGQEVNVLKLGRMPALFVVDKLGRLRYQHYGNNIGDIPRNGDILKLLDELNRQ